MNLLLWWWVPRCTCLGPAHTAGNTAECSCGFASESIILARTATGHAGERGRQRSLPRSPASAERREADASPQSCSTNRRVTRQRVRYRSLAARKPKELRPATESLSVVESDPLPTTTHTKGLS